MTSQMVPGMECVGMCLQYICLYLTHLAEGCMIWVCGAAQTNFDMSTIGNRQTLVWKLWLQESNVSYLSRPQIKEEEHDMLAGKQLSSGNNRPVKAFSTCRVCLELIHAIL